MEQTFYDETKNTSLTDSTSDNSDSGDDEQKTGGQLFASGYGYFGQIATENGESTDVPRLIKELVNVIAVACGEGHSIAITGQGETYTWGCNRYGQLGLADNDHRFSPVKVPDLQNITMKLVACGTQHTIALARNGELYSFGCGSFGRLGHGDQKHQLRPKVVAAMRGKVITQIGAAGWYTACLSDQGAVYTWGCNRYGQLGHGKIAVQLFPRHVTILYGQFVTKMVCGKHHLLLVTDKYECFAIGAGMCGQLGNRNRKHSFLAVMVETQVNVVDAAAGNLHSIAVDAENRILSWGYMSADQLGLSEMGEEYISKPVHLSTRFDSKIIGIYAGGWHSAVILENGKIYMWGFSYKGRLGFKEDPNVHPIEPTEVPFFEDYIVTSVACGGGHSLFIANKR